MLILKRIKNTYSNTRQKKVFMDAFQILTFKFYIKYFFYLLNQLSTELIILFYVNFIEHIFYTLSFGTVLKYSTVYFVKIFDFRLSIIIHSKTIYCYTYSQFLFSVIKI